VLFALERLERDGLEAALTNHRHRVDERVRQHAAQVSALERRTKMLEAAISEARTSDARSRLVLRFDDVLTAVQVWRAVLLEACYAGLASRHTSI
jgi:hypothetical protein